MEKLVKVLLVDDDPIANILNRIIVEDALTHDIDVAENGLEALTFVNKYIFGNICPILILLDINMPVMSGFEFLTELDQVEDRSHFKVIILSSSSLPKDLQMAVAHKVFGYIIKPLTTIKLKQYADQFTSIA